MQTNAFWKKSCGNINFCKSVCNVRALRIEKDGSYLVRLSSSVSFGDIRSELSLRSNLKLDNGAVGRLFKIFSSHSVKVLLKLVSKTTVQVVQRHASHDVVLAVSQSGHVCVGIVSSLKD